MTSRNILVGIFLLACLCSFAAADSYQMYFKFAGIPGDTSVQGEPGWNSVLKWEWASGRSILSEQPIISVTSTEYTGPAMESMNNLNGLSIKFTKIVDKSSPKIMEAFEKKIRIPSAKLCLLGVVDGKEMSVTYELKNVMVTNHIQEGTSEVFVFNYSNITKK